MSNLPETHRALVLHSFDIPPKVEVVPTPKVQPGSAILRILAAPVISYTRDIFLNGDSRKYTYPLPLVPGTSAIGRVAAVERGGVAVPDR